DEVHQMVAYILSVEQAPAQPPSLPVQGTYTPSASADQGTVVLRAAYRDRGAHGLPGAFAEDVVVLRSPTLVVAEGDVSEGINTMKVPQMPVTMSIVQESGSHVRFEDLDLTGVAE